MTTLPLTAPRNRMGSSALAVVVAHPATWLSLIVATSAAARFAASLRHTSPRTFPDEYIYAALARSLAAGDGLVIRGTAARFPALLEPLLAAPLWLVGDTTAAYRLTQGLHVIAVSLAALPVFWLARRLAVPAWQALACAALTVALPSLVFSSYVMADAVAYPLALGAVAAGVAALDRPTTRNQLAFFSLVLLVTLTRVQYAVIPIAFAAAALVVTRGRPLPALRRHRVLVVAFGAPALAMLALGPQRLLGYYDGVLGLRVSPVTLAHWAGVDAMLLAYVAGVAIVPGAVAGLVTGLGRNAAGPHRAFAALTTVFLALVLLEAALYAGSGSERFQERYLMALVPLLPVAFCAGARTLPAGRWLAVAVAAVLVVLSLSIPLSGYVAFDGKQDSPFLMAVARLQTGLGVGSAGLVIALAVGLLASAAVAAALRPRVGVPIALAGAIAAAVAASVGATLFDVDAATRMEATFAAGGNWTWIDDSGLGPTSVLVTPGTDRTTAEVQLFWNRDLQRVLRMPDAPVVDSFGDTPTTIVDDGRLLADGLPVSGPLLVEESFAPMLLDDARLVRRTTSASLWLPRGEVHVAMLTVGRYIDGWLDRKAQITVWPRRGEARAGHVELRLSLPGGLPRAVLRVSAPGFSRRVMVNPGSQTTIRVPVRAATKPVRITLRGQTAILDGERAVVARAELPELVEARPLSSRALLPIGPA
jgi:hypothetical protein